MAEPSYAPRTVAIVALASLVVGFVVIFGGGMALMRPATRGTTRTPDEPPAPAESANRVRDASAPFATRAEPDAPSEAREDPPDDAGEAADGPHQASPPAAVSVAGITLSGTSTSRCFNVGNPAPILSAQCDRLAGLDTWVQSKAAEIATCARAGQHGHLALILDFRFSTSFVRGWGSPTSNIPNPGGVSACVKQKITPLPFAQIPHEHDRYIAVVPIDW